MKKEIKFSLLYRDMFQSSGKYQPRADQLARIAPVIVEMGCFARVETNGGAFEQVNLLYGENPNTAVRTFTKTFNEAGIQTHMLGAEARTVEQGRGGEGVQNRSTDGGGNNLEVDAEFYRKENAEHNQHGG